jgi:hypothetical protein
MWDTKLLAAKLSRFSTRLVGFHKFISCLTCNTMLPVGLMQFPLLWPLCEYINPSLLLLFAIRIDHINNTQYFRNAFIIHSWNSFCVFGFNLFHFPVIQRRNLFCVCFTSYNSLCSIHLLCRYELKNWYLKYIHT